MGTLYTPELADMICAQLADGVSLRTVCLAKDMPDKATVFRWLRKYPEFRALYAAAKEESADALVEDMLDIADDGKNDWMEVHRGDAVSWQANGEAIQRSRLRVDTRKWIAAKMKPKKYGEKVEHAVGGIDGKPIETVTRIELVPMSGNRSDPAPPEADPDI